MVKTLDLKKIEFASLKKLDKSNYKISEKEDYKKTYACDCDGFGGGDPPCDCNNYN